MRIGLFVPCCIDAFFPRVGIATLELLERFGHEVVYPRGPLAHRVTGEVQMLQATSDQATTPPQGVQLPADSVRNKGAAFTLKERREFGLGGLLPDPVDTRDRQVECHETPGDEAERWIGRQLYNRQY